MKQTEIEAKIKLKPEEVVRVKAYLKEYANHAGEFFEGNPEYEYNAFFDKRGQLLKSGEALRIRMVRKFGTRNCSDVGDFHGYVTHKGKLQDSKFKSRVETEGHFGYLETLIIRDLFVALGYRKTFAFAKRRIMYAGDHAAIFFDEVPHLGTFMEVEAKVEQNINRVLGMLNLKGKTLIKQSYVELLKGYAAAHPKNAAKPEEIVFTETEHKKCFTI